MTTIDLRVGRYQDVLQDVECDLLCIDAPYSSRTHKGHNGGAAQANRVTEADENRIRVDRRNGSRYRVGVNRRRVISYDPWTVEDVNACVDFWVPRTRGWFVTLTDHILQAAWTDALNRAGRYVFSPIAFVAPGSRVRMTGDGPAQWACWIVVARPRSPAFFRWGSLPGGYTLPKGLGCAESKPTMIGGKPRWLARELVRHYSRPGDLVCDPCAGAGTTLIAANLEGRSAIGAELDPETGEAARSRIHRETVESLLHNQLGSIPLTKGTAT